MSLPKNCETVVSKLVAKTWLNDEFRKRFFSEPSVVLREAGLMLEEFVEVKVIQNLTATPVLRMAGEGGSAIYEITLTSRPTDLADEQISPWATDKPDALPMTHCTNLCC